MKRKKVVCISGKYFEVCNHLYCSSDKGVRTLYDCYKKPSISKILIYDDWMDWLDGVSENANDYLTVDSYNYARFSLSGYVTYKNQTYVVYITPTRNLIMKVSGEYYREVLGWTN